MLFWVELSIIKAQDIEAEYTYCYNETGFMAYDNMPAFESHNQGSSCAVWCTTRYSKDNSLAAQRAHSLC